MGEHEVVIIGGGAMGSAAMWELARRGVEVLLLEQFEHGHSQGSSHGSSRIVRLAYADPFYIELTATALGRWAQLEEDAGEQLLFVTGAVDHGEQATVEALAAALAASGSPGQRLDPREAGERWPGLVFDGPVLFHPRGGRADADRTVAALQRLAGQRGAQIQNGARAEAITPRNGAVEVRTADDVLRARQVVVAAGAWTPVLLGDLVPRLTVTLEQPAHFPPRDWSDPWPSFIHHQRDAATRTGVSPRGAYGLACPDGVKIGFHAVGPVVDPVSDRRDVDTARLRELQEYVERWVPGVNPKDPDPAPCLYELTTSTDFVIDRVGAMTIAAGFSGHGFKFTPEVGRMVADLVLGTGVPPDRFRLEAHRRSR